MNHDTISNDAFFQYLGCHKHTKPVMKCNEMDIEMDSEYWAFNSIQFNCTITITIIIIIIII